MERTEDIAAALRQDYGFDGGIAYAERIARTAPGGEYRVAYAEAAALLRDQRDGCELTAVTGMTADERGWIG